MGNSEGKSGTAPFFSAEHSSYRMGLLHNDELSPLHVRTHREVDHALTGCQLHSHDFIELAYVRRCGEVEYVIGEKHYQLREGDVLFIPPGMLHGCMLSADVTEHCTRDVVWISQHFLNRVARLNPNRRFYESGDSRLFRTAGTRWACLEELFQKGITERENRFFGWEAMVVGNTMQLLSQLCRALVDESVLLVQEEKPELLFRVMDYMEEHLGEKLTLENVAARFDVSKSTISQIFRRKLDVSFYAYLTRRRLLLSKVLINRGMPLEQVGKQVGFKEHSAFYRAFRQEFGISPREYRSRGEQ